MTESKKKQPRFRVDKEFCAKHGISPNSFKQTIKKMLNYESFDAWYDQTKSVKENLHYAEANGIKTNKDTLYNYCKIRGINTKGTMPTEPQKPSKKTKQPSKKPHFIVDMEFCAKHGISQQTMKNIIRKILNYESFDAWYDQTKRVRENLHYAEANGIKVCRHTLYNYCKARGIDPQGTKPSKKPQQANKNHKTKPEFFNIMDIKDKTIFIYEGLTYIFNNDPQPNKEVRGIFYTDTEAVTIYRDGTSSVHSREHQEAEHSTTTI